MFAIEMGTKFQFTIFLLSLYQIQSLATGNLIVKTCGNFPQFGYRYDAAAVYDRADSIYFMGGISRVLSDKRPPFFLSQIARLNINTQELEVVGEFPSPIAQGAAAGDKDGNVYYFGGKANNLDGPPQSAIYKISPNATTPVHVNDLPRPMSDLTAVSVGDSIFILGGGSGDISKYIPKTNKLEVVAHLPYGVYSPPGVFDGQNVIILGQYVQSTRQIIKFNPTSFELEISESTTIPTWLRTIVSSEPNESILLGSQHLVFNLARYNHVTEELENFGMDAELGPLSGLTAVYVPSNKHLYFNGVTGPPPWPTNIRCVDLTQE